jgi:hypothetical protein
MAIVKSMVALRVARQQLPRVVLLLFADMCPAGRNRCRTGEALHTRLNLRHSGAPPCTLKGQQMAKGMNSKKEVKKPKQEKAKVSATANSLTGKPAISVAGKKVK